MSNFLLKFFKIYLNTYHIKFNPILSNIIDFAIKQWRTLSDNIDTD